MIKWILSFDDYGALEKRKKPSLHLVFSCRDNDIYNEHMFKNININFVKLTATHYAFTITNNDTGEVLATSDKFNYVRLLKSNDIGPAIKKDFLHGKILDAVWTASELIANLDKLGNYVVIADINRIHPLSEMTIRLFTDKCYRYAKSRIRTKQGGGSK